MSLSSLMGVILGLSIVLAASRALYARDERRRGTTASALRWLVLALTAGMATSFFPAAWDDSGGFAVVVVGVPVLCASVAVVADLAGRASTLLGWSAAAVMLIWSLLTSLGLGFYFLLPALLMVVAALMATRPDEHRDSRHGNGQGDAAA